MQAESNKTPELKQLDLLIDSLGSLNIGQFLRDN